ncbi:MAG: MFS transporter [Thermoguttaceae bacterium]|nr:MFS transporter [Thermoguttaceae bacterium]MBR0193009.1 MFS transporter [Thermoguttaceae bacterium]
MHSTIRTRHSQRRILYSNALIWSIGNALTSSIVLIFMMAAYGFSSPLVIAAIFAAPFLGRIFQPFLPAILQKFPFRKNLCISLYVGQVLVLWLLLGTHFLPVGASAKFWLMLGFWALANLLEVMSYAVFLSWNRLLFPARTLGRFYARREIFKILGEVLTIVGLAIPGTIAIISGAFEIPRFEPPFFWGVVAAGTLFILGSVFFLRLLPERRYEIPEIAGSALRRDFQRFLRPFRERKFWPFLIYGALFSFFLQFEQVSQTTFQKIILQGAVFVPFLGMQAVRVVPRFPQIFLARWVGKLVDRYGTLNVMICSQLLTAVPLLFYAFAKPGMGWMLYVAAVIWGSYVGLNVALPKFLLEISDPRDDTPWLAAYGLAGSLAGFAAVFLGGWFCRAFSGWPNYYVWFFLLAFGWRALLALPLIWAKRKSGRISLAAEEPETR